MAVASFTVVVMAAAFAAFIRARFRFESGALLGHGCAQPFQHFLEDAVLADTQKSAGGIAADLRLGVSIAEVKSATQQVAWRGAFDPISRLVRGDDLHHAAVVPLEQVAVAQYRAT